MISVIIPVYNVESYLEDCLQSILHQTYKNIEIICIDDCSTDSSLEILEKYAELDKRIKIIKNNANMSLGYSRNIGLKNANGKYIFFLDSDDWIDLNTLETLFQISERDELEVLMFKAMNYNDDNETFYKTDYYSMKTLTKFHDKIFNYNDLTSNELMNIVVSAWNKLYLKSFLIENNLKFPVGLIHEDNPFFYEMIVKANKISLIDEYFYKRRRRAGSITTQNGKNLLDTIPIIHNCFKICVDNPKVYTKHKKAILNHIFHRLNVKYMLIEDKFKTEFYMNTQKLIVRLCSEYYGLLNDINFLLNEKNLKFFQNLNLNLTKITIILFYETFNSNEFNVTILNSFLKKIFKINPNSDTIIEILNCTLLLFEKNEKYNQHKNLYHNKIFSSLIDYLESLLLDSRIKFFKNIQKKFLVFNYDNDFENYLNEKNKEIFNLIMKFDNYYEFISYHKTNNVEISEVKDSTNTKYCISIIIPIYNTGNTLYRTLNSIINQTFDFNRLEVIMIDDCSNDALTIDIMEEYSKKYDNFKLITLKNNEGSSGIPRNIGIKESKADYIMFLDHDDYYEETTCELLYNNIIQEEIGIAFGHYRRFINNKPSNIPAGNKSGYFKDIADNPKFFTTPPLNIWTKIYKKKIICENNILFPPYLGEDAIFLVKLFLKVKGIQFLKDEIVYNYDIKQTSTVNNLDFSHLIESILSELFIYKCFNENNTINYFKYRISTLCDFILPKILVSDLSTNELIYIFPLLRKLCNKFYNLNATPTNNVELYNIILKNDLKKFLNNMTKIN